MKRNDLITTINTLIADNPTIDFDPVPEDTKEKAKDLKALLADVQEAVEKANAPVTIKLSDICKALDKDPKTVRARARRDEKLDDPVLPKPVPGAKQRWTFFLEDKEAVEAFVTNED